MTDFNRLRTGLVAASVLLLCLVLAPAQPAFAAVYAPPKGKIWHGVTAGEEVRDFTARTGKAPAVWQTFVRWGAFYEHAFARARSAQARVMLHVSTSEGQGSPGVISPGQIARGGGDSYLLELNRRIAEHGRPVYIRFMGEMNNCNNAYAAYDCNGRRRSADFSAVRFKQAWRRSHLIVRGGDVATLNARLRRMRLAPVRTGETSLPRAPVAFMWAPMTGGSPMISALAPQVYWPGRRYVDWVGTSFYSRFPNFHHLEPYYQRFAVKQRKPFAFAEWAMWGSDNPDFARRLFGWINTHPRVKMLQYNQGALPSGPFRLRHYPRSARVIAGALGSPRFAGRTP